jgi:hypothetical protein
MCRDASVGLTGWVGATLEAVSIEDAKSRMTMILNKYKRNKEEPKQWP